MNAYAESFVKSIKTEGLNKIILTSENQLRYVMKEYLEYYNHERPHRGLGGKMIEPRATGCRRKDSRVEKLDKAA